MAQQVVINASQTKQELETLLNRITDADERIVIERDGDPVAVMMSYQEYKTYRQQMAHHLLTEIGKKLGAEVEKQGLTEEQLIEEFRETRQELFNEKYGHLFKQD